MSTQLTSMPSMTSSGLPVGNRALEIEFDGRRGARHAIDRCVAFVSHLAIRRLHDRIDQRLRVDVENAHGGLGMLCGDQAGFNREGADGDQHVAAVGFRVDELFVDLHLREQVIDVSVGTLRRADHRHLARHRVRAADAVDLYFVR
jgi:hypothetical protein